jgi:SagB-type dehydrogenase family enzyme
MKWKPSLTIRQNHIDQRDGIQLSDPIEMKRLLISRQDMLDAVMNADTGTQSDSVEALNEHGVLAHDWTLCMEEWASGLEHWERRNWNLAASYYLWARRDTFLDEGPEYEAIRCEALETMLKVSDVPLPVSIEASETVDLGVPTPIPHEETIGAVLRRRVTTQTFQSDRHMDSSLLAGLLENGFSISRRYHVPDIKEHIHNLLHGVGFAFDPYVAVFNVAGLDPGIYYYSISQNRLRLQTIGNFRNDVCAGLIGHEQALAADCTIFLVVDFRRFQWRYRHERALRNLYVDVGRMAKYLILVATAYGIRNHLTPATVDTVLGGLLNIDPERRQVFYSITFGY